MLKDVIQTKIVRSGSVDVLNGSCLLMFTLYKGLLLFFQVFASVQGKLGWEMVPNIVYSGDPNAVHPKSRKI